MSDPRYVGGATGVTMERWSAGIALTYLMILPLVWLTNMDTGVVFMRRADFLNTGGYPEGRHYAEDVAFLWKLIRLGRSRGQRMTRLRSCKSIASTRKFDKYGDWHYFWMMPGLALGTVRPGFSGSPKARAYCYNDR
jgi:hypothetical protein